jgi:hypothetical protein
MDSKLLMPCHAMPKGEIFTAAYYIRNILAEIISLLRVERDVKGTWLGMRTRQGHIQPKSRERFAMAISCQLRQIHYIHRTLRT